MARWASIEFEPSAKNGCDLTSRTRAQHRVGAQPALLCALANTVDAIAFREGWRAADLRPGDMLDIAFNLEQNEWQGQKRIEIHVRDLRQT